MTAVLSVNRETSLGANARQLRKSLALSRQELAHLAGVSPEEAYLFEKGLPVRLDARRRLLKELWSRKARGKSPASN